MAISGNLLINIGLPNESQGSDSLYSAFNKINTNFNILFGNASKVVAGNGIAVVNNAGNTVVSANLLAGDGIALDNVNGAIRITNTGGGNGGGSSNIVGILPGNGILINGSNSVGAFSGCVNVALSNSGVNAQSYINPTITVDQFGRIVSASNNLVTGTVTSVGLTPGQGISIAGGPITTSGLITVTNTGVTSLTAGAGVTLSGSNGAVTISATGGGGGNGSVTSVGVTSNTGLVITNSPIISSGNIGVNLPNNLSIVGNVTANKFIGNGSGLTAVSVAVANVTGLGNIATYNLDGNASNVLHGDGTWSADITNYGNSNVANYLPTYTGNLTAGNANLGNTANANYFVGNGYYLTGLNLSNVIASNANYAAFAGNVTTASQPNITTVGTLTSLGVNGTITGVNITANTGVFTGNGSGLSVLNASNISSGTLAQNRLANASLTLGSTSLTLGATTTTVAGLSSVTSTTFVGALTGAATTAGTVTTAAQPNITSVGTLSSLAVTGNISAGNVSATTFTGALTGAATTAGTVTTAAQPNITSVGTLTGLGVNGTITAVNITANTGVFTGNGSGLSAIDGANITGTVANATHSSTANTVTTAAQPNITSVGTLSSLSVTGNVTSNIVKTTAVLFSALPLASTAGAGSRSFITDGNLAMSGNFGSLVTGGAGNSVPVISDGTNWRIG